MVSLLSLQVGCDTKKTANETIASSQTKANNALKQTRQLALGDSKQYWIQSYSSIFKDEIDWSNKDQRFGIKALVKYQIEDVNLHQIKLDAITNYIELLIKDNTAYLNPLLQTILTDGIEYKLNQENKTPLQINPKNKQLIKQIADSHHLQTDYQYLETLFVSPFLPTLLPLEKGHKITIAHFMQIDTLTITTDEITPASVHITLEAKKNNFQIYGKAVVQKDTGWLERLALVKQTSLKDQPTYKIRTVLLVGPTSWSNNASRQLTNEMQIKDTESYLQPFTIFDFDVEHWQQAQLQEKNNQPKEGNIYTLTTPDGSNQLMLVTNSYTNAVNQLLGAYQVTNLVLFDKNNKILPNITLLPTTNIAYKIKVPNGTETNLVSYKLASNEPATNKKQLEDISKITALINFTPYKLEKIILPLTHKTQKATSLDKSFSADISPTDDVKSYILHWQCNDNVIFNPQLMQGGNNSLVQYIQPDTISWLTPAETRLVNSIINGYENRVKITFTTSSPPVLILYVIHKNNALETTTTSGNVTFTRHP